MISYRVSVEGKELDDIFTCCRTKLLATPTTESLLPNLQRRYPNKLDMLRVTPMTSKTSH
jgi:hypothetical protein